MKNFRLIEIFIKQMISIFERTSQLVTVLDCQKEVSIDFHYPIIIQITQTIVAMLDQGDMRITSLLVDNGLLDRWT